MHINISHQRDSIEWKGLEKDTSSSEKEHRSEKVREQEWEARFRNRHRHRRGFHPCMCVCVYVCMNVCMYLLLIPHHFNLNKSYMLKMRPYSHNCATALNAQRERFAVERFRSSMACPISPDGLLRLRPHLILLDTLSDQWKER